MPIIFTRGSLSARGAGTFSLIPPVPVPPTPGPPVPPPPPPPPGPPGPVTQTVTFTSSGSWTAPAGVSQITNLIIGGGQFTLVPEQWVYDAQQTAVASVLSVPPAQRADGPYTYAQATSYAEGVLAAYNLGGPGDRIIGYSVLTLGTNILLNPQTSQPFYWTELGGFNSIRVRGPASRTFGPWDNTSGQTANGNGAFWFVGVEVFVPASNQNGSPSSAFGFTVQGGTQNDPNPSQSFGSVSVTPGQTYSINVGGPQGGFVQFQFVQG